MATELGALRTLVAEQALVIEQQRQRTRALKARLSKDSHNSSKPPSSDPPFKKPPPRSQHKPSRRKPGGQKGHRGATRTLVDAPDHRVIVPLMGSCTCGRCRAQIATEVLPERRQVVELVIRREVTEYPIVGGTCACGRVQRSTFPDGVDAPVQYGPGVSAFAVYMTQYPLRLYQRTADVLNEVAGIAISPGSIDRAVKVAAERVKEPVQAICRALVGVQVAPADAASHGERSEGE